MRNEIEIAARERFGEPNRAASSSTELRFGRNGSKSVELAGERAGSWFDFETDEGGHLIDTSAPVIEPPQMATATGSGRSRISTWCRIGCPN